MDQAPYTPPQNPTSPAPEKSSAGPIIGAVIVIVILALGALYFWGAQLNEAPEELPLIPGDAPTGEEWAPSGSGSDEAAAIESDLDATDMAAFEAQMEADLRAIEAEL
ncbi:hypothetical protein C4585_03225 [Candidatus Parcubacteria bacterium]|nr:MAG: hypothetical protein C4585_03225 [Candidatus Parcubacteria bacterium]